MGGFLLIAEYYHFGESVRFTIYWASYIKVGTLTIPKTPTPPLPVSRTLPFRIGQGPEWLW